MENLSPGILAIIGILIIIVVFIACRELTCWYFKINEVSGQNVKIIRLLSEIALKNGADEERVQAILHGKPLPE